MLESYADTAGDLSPVVTLKLKASVLSPHHTASDLPSIAFFQTHTLFPVSSFLLDEMSTIPQ